MAKGNLFLGTAARSVGDVVMYRREGSQVSRVRVRKIANPKTDAQCEQRTFMAAVVKFYQPLANVLDRSWQGLSRAKSYAKFLKVNVAKVREAGYYLKKDTGFFPLPLQLSNGTLPIINYALASDAISIPNIAADATVTTIGGISKLFNAIGISDGCIVTIIGVKKDSNNNFTPVSYQFEVDSTSVVTVATALPQLTFSYTGAADDSGDFDIAPVTGAFIAGAVIAAKNVDGVWQRSKQTMAVDATTLANTTSAEAKAAAIASYKGAAASDNPLVYLDGDELQ